MRCKTVLIAWCLTAATFCLTAADDPSAGGAEPGGLAVSGFGAVEQARAQSIGLSGPSTARVGQEVVLRITGAPEVDILNLTEGELDWFMGPSRFFCYLAVPGFPLQPLSHSAEFVVVPHAVTLKSIAPLEPIVRIACVGPGTVRVIVDWNHGQNQLVSHTITIGGPAPNPSPTPEPGPDPAPDPIPPPLPLTEMTVVVVEESADRTREQAWVILDPTVRIWLKANGHKRLRTVDQTNPSPDMVPLVERAKTAQTEGVPFQPRVFILGPDGAVSFAGELPISPIGMLELVKEWGATK